MLVLLCNVLPSVTDTSHGAWRRLVSINFPTLFTADTITKKCEMPLDPDIDIKLRRCADSFLMYLLNQLHIAFKSKNVLHVPDSITKLTSVYQTESDFYMDYFNESIAKGVGTDCLEWTNVWTNFYHWFR